MGHLFRSMHPSITIYLSLSLSHLKTKQKRNKQLVPIHQFVVEEDTSCHSCSGQLGRPVVLGLVRSCGCTAPEMPERREMTEQIA